MYVILKLNLTWKKEGGIHADTSKNCPGIFRTFSWEWKVNELQTTTASGSQKNSGKHDPSYQIDDLHIPMVHVSDDFDLANC